MTRLSSFATVLRLTFPDGKLPLEKSPTEYLQLEAFFQAIKEHPTYTFGKDAVFRNAEIGRPNCVIIYVASRTEKRSSMDMIAEAIPALQQLLPLLEYPPQIKFSNPCASGSCLAQFPHSVIELITFTIPYTTLEAIDCVSEKPMPKLAEESVVSSPISFHVRRRWF